MSLSSYKKNFVAMQHIAESGPYNDFVPGAQPSGKSTAHALKHFLS